MSADHGPRIRLRILYTRARCQQLTLSRECCNLNGATISRTVLSIRTLVLSDSTDPISTRSERWFDVTFVESPLLPLY